VSKFSVTYVKSHPVMFGAIFLVFGLFLFLLLNRGGSSGGGSITVQNPGPSDAAIQAGVQLQGAQLAASTQIGLAQLSIQEKVLEMGAQRDIEAAQVAYQMKELEASHDLGVRQIDASLTALATNLFAQTSMAHDNNVFMLDYAKNAQDSATAQLMIGAQLQATLGAQQEKAFEFGSLMSAASRLKKAKLERFLTNVSNNVLGDPSNNAPQPASSSSGNTTIPIFGALSFL